MRREGFLPDRCERIPELRLQREVAAPNDPKVRVPFQESSSARDPPFPSFAQQPDTHDSPSSSEVCRRICAAGSAAAPMHRAK